LVKGVAEWVYTLTTQVQVFFDANLGAYFFLTKCHLVPPTLVEPFFLSMDRKTLNYDHMAVEVPNGDIMVSEFLMSFM
jgi:hypothetical protein